MQRARPKTRQTVLFSATFDGAIARLAGKLLRDPVRIEADADKAPPVAIEQRVHFTDDHAHKNRVLDHLLADVAMTQSIVFIATKRDAESLAARLRGEGHAAAALHGDMNQFERTRTLTEMRRGRVRTLVATDVAARGIDVAGISHVINFDLPRQAGDYVHRIGRTGRAGAAGIAVSLAGHAERGALRQIERYTGAAITTHVIPGLEPRARSASNDRGAHSKGAPRNAHHRPSSHPRSREEGSYGARNRALVAVAARTERIGLAGEEVRPLAVDGSGRSRYMGWAVCGRRFGRSHASSHGAALCRHPRESGDPASLVKETPDSRARGTDRH